MFLNSILIFSLLYICSEQLHTQITVNMELLSPLTLSPLALTFDDNVTSLNVMTYYEELMPILPGDDVIAEQQPIRINASNINSSYAIPDGAAVVLIHPPYQCGVFQFVWNTLILGLLCLLGILGNTVSFAVLSRDRSNRVACLLLQALALADNSVLIVAFMVLTLVYGLQVRRSVE
jgi:hypothetical protein